MILRLGEQLLDFGFLHACEWFFFILFLHEISMAWVEFWVAKFSMANLMEFGGR